MEKDVQLKDNTDVTSKYTKSVDIGENVDSPTIGVNSPHMNDLSKHRAQEYLIEHPISNSDDEQKKVLENVFIDAFSKGYQCGFNDLANLLNAMWSPEPVKTE